MSEQQPQPKRNLEHLQPVGHRGLAEIIVTNAVRDYKKLVEAGVIKDGKVTDYWPKYQAESWLGTKHLVNKQFDGLRCVADAQDVIDFLRGKWCKWLCLNLYSMHIYKTMLKELGL